MKRNRELDRSWLHWLVFYAMALISACLVYGHSVQFFFWQDDFYLLEFVDQQSLIDYIRISFTRPADILPLNLGVVFRPLTHYVYFRICRILFGLEPSLYRMPIAFLLFLDGVLVAKYCQIITRKFACGSIAGIIFIVNRAHFTPLYWITASHEIAVTCFMLLSVIAYLQGLEQVGKRKIYHCISGASLILALLSKENAVVLPVLIALSVFLRLESDSSRERLCACRHLWPHFLIVLAFLAVRAPLIAYALSGGGNSYYSFSRLANLAISYLWGFWWHLETFVEPWRTILDGLTRSFSLFQPLYVAALGIILNVAGAVWLIRRNDKASAANPIWLGLAWFFVSAVPALVTGIRAAYLFSIPAIGFAMGLAYLVESTIAGVCRGSMARRHLLLGMFLVLSMTSARFVVLKLEKTTWPVKYMPLAAETIEVAQQQFFDSDWEGTICLVDFPIETWWPERLQAAFHVFVDPEISVCELTTEELDGGKCPPSAPQLKYTNYEIAVYEPARQSEDSRDNSIDKE